MTEKEWHATHRVPGEGLPAWSLPDPASETAPPLPGLIEVEVVDHRPSGWMRVRCDNGWETWVDGRRLEVNADWASWVELVPALHAAGSVADLPAEIMAVSPETARSPDPIRQPTSSPTAVTATPAAPAAPAGPAPAPAVTAAPAAPAAPAAKSSRLSPRLTLVITLGLAAALIGIRVSTADWDPSTSQARGASGVVIVLMVVLFGFGLLGARKPARVRPVFDVVRGACSLGAIVAVGTATDATGEPVLLIAAALLGVAAGTLEGILGRVVTGQDGRRYARRPALSLLIGSVGLLIAVGAAAGDAPDLVGYGQVIGLAGIGLLFGLVIGRQLNAAPATASAANPGLAALALLVLALGVATMLAPTPATPAAHAGTDDDSPFDGTYTGTLELGAFAPTDGTSTVTVNRVELTLADGQLTGTVAMATKQTFPVPEEFAGEYPICLYFGVAPSGSDLTVTPTDDGLDFSGSPSQLLDLRVYATSEEQSADTCKDFPAAEPSGSSAMTVHITESGMTGTWAPSFDLGTGENAIEMTFSASRSGGPPTTENAGTTRPSTTQRPTTTEQPPISVDGEAKPPKAEDPSPPPTPPADPNTTPPTDTKPIDPKAALTGAILGALGAAGAAAAGAAGAGGDGFGEELPADVRAALGGGPARQTDAFGEPVGYHDQTWDDTKRILDDPYAKPTFNPQQYIDFIEHLEADTPGATWQQLAATLHSARYGGNHNAVDDVKGKLPHTDINLFEQGPETDGWEQLRERFPSFGNNGYKPGSFTQAIPWKVDSGNGVVDINHAMAGLRSDLNRGSDWRGIGPRIPGTDRVITVDRDFLRWANTQGGDQWQVLTYDPPKEFVPHWYTPRDSLFKPIDQTSIAIPLPWGGTFVKELRPNYLPPDQALGNAGGVWLSDYYRARAGTPAANTPLSQAMRDYFDHLAGRH